jgi:hypothetical protein
MTFHDPTPPTPRQVREMVDEFRQECEKHLHARRVLQQHNEGLQQLASNYSFQFHALKQSFWVRLGDYFGLI